MRHIVKTWLTVAAMSLLGALPGKGVITSYYPTIFMADNLWGAFMQLNNEEVILVPLSYAGIDMDCVDGYYGNMQLPSEILHNGITYRVTGTEFPFCEMDYLSLPESIVNLNGIEGDWERWKTESPRVYNHYASVKQIYFSEGLLTINGINGVKDLTHLQLPNSVVDVTGISDCPDLYSLKFGDNIQTIHDNSLSNLTALTELNLGNVRIIGQNVANNCTALEYVRMPENIFKYGDYLLRGCSSLKTVDVGTYPLLLRFCMDCPAIETIICMNPYPPGIGYETFNAVDAENCVVIVPDGCRETYLDPEVQRYTGWRFNNIIEASEASGVVNLKPECGTALPEGMVLTPGSIRLTAEVETLYSVTDASGRMVGHGSIAGHRAIDVPPGIYVVTLGDSSAKVLVR